MSAWQLGSIGVGVVLALWALGAYNRLVRLRNGIGSAHARLDAALELRHSHVQSMIEWLRDSAPDEADAIQALGRAQHAARAARIQAKATPLEATLVRAQSRAEAALEDALAGVARRLEARSSALDETQRARQAHHAQATPFEPAAGHARRTHEAAVLQYNEAARQFPTRVITGLFGFRDAAAFDAMPSPDRSASPSLTSPSLTSPSVTSSSTTSSSAAATSTKSAP
jgi:LemA protein